MSEKLQERLRAFTYHAPGQDVQVKMGRLRRDLQDLTKALDEAIPECREKSLGFTALEESAMWFMKALSHTDPEGKQVSP